MSNHEDNYPKRYTDRNSDTFKSLKNLVDGKMNKAMGVIKIIPEQEDFKNRKMAAVQFKTQQEIWEFLSANENNKIIHKISERIYGFKNGEMWDYFNEKHTDHHFRLPYDWEIYLA
jgi:hypothetical protein